MLKNEQLNAYFESLEVDLAEAHGLFDVLDEDLSGDVSTEEFVEGCLRLRGEATAVDCVKLLHHRKKLERGITGIMMLTKELHKRHSGVDTIAVGPRAFPV